MMTSTVANATEDSMSTRVTTALAARIWDAIFIKQFEAEEKLLEEELAAIATAVAERYTGEYMEMVRKLPTDMIRWQSNAYVSLGDGELCRLAGASMVSLRFTESVPYVENMSTAFLVHEDFKLRLVAYFTRRNA